YPDIFFFFFFNDTATTEIYTLSLHDALPISPRANASSCFCPTDRVDPRSVRSAEHTSELQSRSELVCRLLLEQKKTECHPEQVEEMRWKHRVNVEAEENV